MKKIILFTLICFLSLSGVSLAVDSQSGESMMPGGRWWRMPEVSEKLNLTSEEQTKLDELYIQNRRKLIDLKNVVEKEGLALEQIMKNDKFDESTYMNQFKKLQDARTRLATEVFKFLVEVRRLIGFDRLKVLYQHLKIKFDKHQIKKGMHGPDWGMLGQGRPRQGWPGPSETDTSSIRSSPMPKTEVEKKILSVLEELKKSQMRQMANISPEDIKKIQDSGRLPAWLMANVPMEDGRLLRMLTETIGAKHVVEIGTSNGYSALWLSLGLQTTGGKLTTFEIDPYRASLARKNFKRAGVDHIVTLIEGDAHNEVTKLKEPIDILFIDADKSGYLDYLNKLLPLVRPGGLILAHNMNFPPPDPEYIKAITTNPNLETIFLHMDGPGIGVTLKKR